MKEHFVDWNYLLLVCSKAVLQFIVELVVGSAARTSNLNVRDPCRFVFLAVILFLDVLQSFPLIILTTCLVDALGSIACDDWQTFPQSCTVEPELLQ